MTDTVLLAGTNFTAGLTFALAVVGVTFSG
jgi:hypothetical protein